MSDVVLETCKGVGMNATTDHFITKFMFLDSVSVWDRQWIMLYVPKSLEGFSINLTKSFLFFCFHFFVPKFISIFRRFVNSIINNLKYIYSSLNKDNS